MTPETKKYLQEVKERAELATRGEWYVAEVPRMNSIPHQKIRSKDGAIDHAVAEAWGGYGPNPCDAEFIAASRTDIPRLLDLIAEQEEEAETLRMQLAGCGVAALCNTEKTVAQRIPRDNPYWSASYGDVCDAVDREMKHRALIEKQEEELKAFRERLGPVGYRIVQEHTEFKKKIEKQDAVIERYREALEAISEYNSGYSSARASSALAGFSGVEALADAEKLMEAE